MPLYMDRHDLPDATAADIANAHLRDLEVQERFGVRFITYWFEEEAGSAFCLVEGPDKESVEAAHSASHGMLPLNVVEVDEASIRGFFGRLNTHPPGEPYVESAFRAILFTDMVDSTRLTQQLGDSEAMQLVRQHDSIVRSGLAQFGGSEVKHTGDGSWRRSTRRPERSAPECKSSGRLESAMPMGSRDCGCASGWPRESP
jgi:hypothetical protein